MTTSLSNPQSSFTLYRDRKLATWALYEPRVGNTAMPYWQAMSDGYGKKTTIVAATKDAAIAKLEEYSKTHERHISFAESDTVFTYGVYGLLGGGLLTAVGYLGSFGRLSRLGGVIAASGLATAAAGKVFEPKKSDTPDEIVLDLPKVPGVV